MLCTSGADKPKLLLVRQPKETALGQGLEPETPNPPGGIRFPVTLSVWLTDGPPPPPPVATVEHPPATPPPRVAARPVIGEYVLGLLDGAQPGEDEARFSLDRARPAQVGMRTGGDSIVTTWQGY